MNTTNLTGKELSNLHNAGCYLDMAIRDLSETLNPKMLKDLKNVQKLLEAGIKRARKESDKQDDAHQKVASELASSLSLDSAWSAGVVEFESTPYPKATKLVYDGFWAQDDEQKDTISVKLNDKTWLGLWKSADALIKESRDSHHIFVEQIAPRDGDDTVLYLSTGS